MASRTLVSGLPRSLPPLPPGPAPTCVPCVEGRQCAALHSSTFPPTEAPLQTLHMDVWGPARIRGQGHERYFLLVVDDYSRYTTFFPLRSEGEVTEVLIDWIRGAHRQLSESFGSDLPILRLHSDRGGEISPDLLRAFCRAEGIRQTFTLPASPQQNGIAERRIGMVMDVARTSMIHAAAPYFLWPFAVQYAAHQINLQPPFVCDNSADKLSSRAIPCVFLGFPPDAPGWQFYHPTLRRVLSSQDATFDESVSYYRLFPYRTASLPPPPLFLAPGTPPVEPLPPQGPAPSGVSEVDPAEPVEVAVDSGAARGAEPAGAGTGGAEPGVSVSVGAELGGAELERVEPGGAEPGGAESGSAEPGGAEPERAASGGPPGAAGAGDTAGAGVAAGAAEGAAGAGGAAGAAGGAAGVGAAGGAGATGPGGARIGGTRAAGAGGAAGVGATGARAVDTGGTSGAGAAGGTGAGGAAGDVAGDPRAEGTGAVSAVFGVHRLSSHTCSYSRPLQFLVLLLTLDRLEVLRSVEPESRPVSPEYRSALPVCTVRAGRCVSRPRPPPVPGTHSMRLRPSTAPQRVPLPSPLASSLPDGPDPESDSLRAASPTVTRFLATAVTGPLFESTAASALVAELVDFAAACRLDFATSLVAESASASICPPSVGGECALGTDVLEDRQEEFECFAAAVPHLMSMLLAPEVDPDAPDIPTLRSYTEAIEGPYSSQWQAAMDTEMASWKSTGTYVDEVPPPGANIVSGMWIFRVKRPPGSPPVFKARYVARGFSQQQGVDFFQTFSPTLKMTTLRVLLHVAAQRDYEIHLLDFSTAFLQGSLHEEIWLRRPAGFTRSFPPGTQWSLWRPVYGLRQAPCEWHDTLRTTLAALGFSPSTADPSLFLCTDTTLPPFYVLVYVDDLVIATVDTEALAHVRTELHKRHTCTDPGELTSYLGLRITRDRAQRTITLTQSHMVQQVLQCFGFTYSSPQSTPLPTGHSLLAPPSNGSVEPSGPTSGMGLVLGGRARVVLTGHVDAFWVDDLATQRSSQGYTFSLGSGSVSWRSTRSSSVLSSSCEAEIYARAMAAQELRWLTYLLTDLGEAPRSPPVLYVDNNAMLALCQEHRLEHRTKHIALRYFLARELQQRGQLRLAYVASQANTADVFTKALQPCDHQRFCTVIGLASSESGEADRETWHERLCLVNFPMLQKLAKDGSLKGLEVKGAVKEIGSCPTCLETKFTKFPFSSGTGPAKAPLALVHMDVVGPTRAPSLSGSRYFLTIVDDHRRAVWVYPLKTKGEVAAAVLKEWMPRAQRESGHKVKVIRTDNGGEFIGADFEAVLKKKGIQHQLTVPYNPQQNGMGERFNRTLQEGARTLLGRAGLPDPFWVTALRQVALVKNRVLATMGDKQWVPYTKWYGSAPSVNMLRAHGCMVVFHVPKEKRGKLEAYGRWGVHLGLAKDHKGWLIWDLTRQQLTVSRDVKFLESLYYKEWKLQQQKLPTTPLIIEADEVQRPSRQVQVTVSDEEISGVTEDGGEPEVEEQQQPQQQQKDAPPRTQRAPDRPRRDVRPPNKLTSPSFGKPKLVRDGSVAEQCDEDEIAHCYWAAVPEPKTLAEALSGPDAEKWKQSVKEEYDSLLENETWELCELPPRKKAISSKLIFRHKYGPDGELTRYKSRLVAKGFQQTKGKDFDEIFALVGKGTTLRVMLGMAANRGWRIKQMDITTAFLNGIILEELYMLLRERLDDGSGRVCRLKKAIYGLKQAPRAWYHKMEETLLAGGFKKSECDHNFVVSRPSHEQLEAAKRLVRYVSATTSVGLEYSVVRQRQQRGAVDLGKGEMLLTCYTDASFNSVKADGTSIGGYVCLFGGGAESWRSKKQNKVGLSSCETEYMALHHGVKEVVWLRRLLEEIGVCQREPTVIYCCCLLPLLLQLLLLLLPVVLLLRLRCCCCPHCLHAPSPRSAAAVCLLLRAAAAATYRVCCSLLLLLLAATVATCCCCSLLLLLPTATAAATPLAAAAAAATATAAMANFSVLTFDAEGRAISFDVWLDDLQLYLESEARDGFSLFVHTEGTLPAPAAIAVEDHSKWLMRDATARLTVRNHLPVAERAHFSQQKTTKALYDAIVARYSSPATAALGRLMLPYLHPEVAEFYTVSDLFTHLRSSEARYRAALKLAFLAANPPPLYMTVYFLVTHLPDSLRTVRDQFLALDPTEITLDSLEKSLLEAEKSTVAVAASRGTPRSPSLKG
ncbi:unnamed protein product [Closterium sp. NIES-54]